MRYDCDKQYKGFYDVSASYVNCSELPGLIVNNN